MNSYSNITNFATIFVVILVFSLYSSISPKIITQGMVKPMLNYLTEYPEVTATIIQSVNAAKKTTEQIDSSDENLSEKQLEEHIKHMTKNISDFFKGLHTLGFAVKPMLEESFNETEFDVETSLLYGFFNDDSVTEIGKYLEQNTKTKQNLKTLCKEFTKFWSDIQKTMPNVFQEGKSYLKSKIKEAQDKKEDLEQQET